MNSRSRTLGIVAVLVLIASSCGGGEVVDTTTTTEATTTTTVASTTTTRAEGDVTLEPPAEIGAGTSFSVGWTGPDNEGDYITIVPAGADEGAYESYFYTAHGPSGDLIAPIEAGEYEIRYVDGESETTVYSITITVSEYAITFESPDEVEAGTEFEVSWTGPNGPGDYLTVVAPDAPEGSYEWYFYTVDGPTGTLVAPVEDGEFEIRYVSGSTSATLGSMLITVTPYIITLEVPVEVEAGSTFQVVWTGPDGPSDYITIVEAGAPLGAYLDYGYTSEGSPITLTAPDQPGDYEVWYASDRVSLFTFASIPITVK